MNIENLKEGMVVKNYKELCKLLGLEPKKANSKKAQLKEIERYFGYHKEGQKIIIDEIYKEKKPKKDKRVEGGYPEMRTLILRLLLLSDQEPNRAVFPTSTLLRKINAVNVNYATGRRCQEELSEYLGIDQEYVGEFYDSTHTNLKNALETNLNNLRDDRLIFWSKTIMVCKNNPKIKLNELGEIEMDEEGNVVAEVYQDFREATQEEKEKILSTEKKVLETLGVEKVTEVFKKGLSDIFYKEVYKRVRRSCNISFYFNAYDITFIRDNIEKELKKIESVSDLRESYMLNQRVKDKVLINAENRSDKAKNDNSNKKSIKVRQADDYIENTIKLIDIVIDMSAKNIIEELKHKSSLKGRVK